VIEFFWYNCGHCNTFEPVFESWAKGAEAKGVVARRVPVAFNASFVPQQKLFYALQGMGKVAEIHPRVFRAIHVEKINLSKEDAIMAWMAKQPGIDMAKFKEMYASFNVASQAQRAAQLQEAYGVEGTPSMGVAGRFYTDGTMAGSLNAVLQVVDHLVGRVPQGLTRYPLRFPAPDSAGSASRPHGPGLQCLQDSCPAQYLHAPARHV
jgi:thiol:disulfide interchange protein DsbA